MADRGFLDSLIKESGNEMIYENERLIVGVTEVIEILMEDKKISKSRLAQLLGVSVSNVSQMLNGTKNMTLKSISEILFHLEERMIVGHEPLYVENEIFAYDSIFANNGGYEPLSLNVTEVNVSNPYKQVA